MANETLAQTGVDSFSWTLDILILRNPHAQNTFPHPAEFRQQIIELVRAGRTPAELSRELQVTAQTVQNWVGQAARDVGQPLPAQEGLSAAEREELTTLRRQVKLIQQQQIGQAVDNVNNINSKYRRSTIHLASEGVDRTWTMRRGFKSPNYTGDWKELPVVR